MVHCFVLRGNRMIGDIYEDDSGCCNGESCSHGEIERFDECNMKSVT